MLFRSLLNRTPEKAEKIAEEVNRACGTGCVVPMRTDGHGKIPGDRKYLAIQATSVGLYPNVEEAVILDMDFYKKIHTGYDLIYKPPETKFMSLIRQAGGRAFHGLKMLLYQGVIAYELWNGITVAEEDALTVYGKIKEAMGGGRA